jgi:hypothetical protein
MGRTPPSPCLRHRHRTGGGVDLEVHARGVCAQCRDPASMIAARGGGSEVWTASKALSASIDVLVLSPTAARASSSSRRHPARGARGLDLVDHVADRGGAAEVRRHNELEGDLALLVTEAGVAGGVVDLPEVDRVAAVLDRESYLPSHDSHPWMPNPGTRPQPRRPRRSAARSQRRRGGRCQHRIPHPPPLLPERSLPYPP